MVWTRTLQQGSHVTICANAAEDYEAKYGNVLWISKNNCFADIHKLELIANLKREKIGVKSKFIIYVYKINKNVNYSFKFYFTHKNLFLLSLTLAKLLYNKKDIKLVIVSLGILYMLISDGPWFVI